jgi:DNA-binding cell septation regulator SpoVG
MPLSPDGPDVADLGDEQRTSKRPHKGAIVIITITLNDRNNPPGKLADAELHFTEGVLEGLKLVGFGVWERRSGNGRNVTFPARQYTVNGERRSYSLLRPIADATAQDRIREAILNAYAENEERAAVEPEANESDVVA